MKPDVLLAGFALATPAALALSVFVHATAGGLLLIAATAVGLVGLHRLGREGAR